MFPSRQSAAVSATAKPYLNMKSVHSNCKSNRGGYCGLCVSHSELSATPRLQRTPEAPDCRLLWPGRSQTRVWWTGLHFLTLALCNQSAKVTLTREGRDLGSEAEPLEVDLYIAAARWPVLRGAASLLFQVLGGTGTLQVTILHLVHAHTHT